MTSDSDPVFELGKNLADALDTSDIIGRWMSHHVVDLITRSEAHPNDQELATETREVILKLWEHKAGGRFTTTPFEYLGPILAALARLEPDPPPWAHFGTLSPDELPSPEELAGYPVLAAACDMDREFGQVVRLAVALAAQESLDREEPWVVAGMAVAGTEVDVVLQLLQGRLRAYRRQAALSVDPVRPDEPLEPDSNEVTKPAESNSGGRNGHLTADDEVLAVALKAAITRCTKLLERIDQLVPAPDLAAAPTVSEARDDPSEGSA